MGSKVCKFGGSSLAQASQFVKVAEIVKADAQRRYIVPSAPGKRSPDDQKITDLLYLCHEHARQGVAFDQLFELISQRYLDIASELGLTLDLQSELDEIKQGIRDTAPSGPDYAASRGEYLNGLIMAAYLGYTFVDAADVVSFDTQGRLDMPDSRALMQQRLAPLEQAVVPGFYGRAVDGTIKTFSRGGSDITGAVVSAGIDAEVYENWTDVSGLLMADPRVIDKPRSIDTITYQELRELAYMGATVLHDEAIFPVREAGIPVNIRNTNEPSHPGTRIVAKPPPGDRPGPITGVAGRKDFTVIAIYKAMMNNQIGFGRRVLSVFEANGISYEHTPSGIDTMSIVVADSAIEGKLDHVLHEIGLECKPDSIETYPDMALVATVGRGMTHTVGVAAKLFAALAKAEVNIRMIDQGSSELNIIVGVQADEFENAMRAAYQAFIT